MDSYSPQYRITYLRRFRFEMECVAFPDLLDWYFYLNEKDSAVQGAVLLLIQNINLI